VITSTHKIVGSLTQSAMLHVAPTGRIDPDQLARMVRLTRSTSPSALLMSSLDAARRQLAVHGEALLERTMAAGDRARAAIDAVPGVRVIGGEFVGRPGVVGWDPMRIVIDVRATGCTGYEVAAGLREAYDIHVELATHATMVLILGLGQPPEDLERFAHDFAAVVRRIGRPGSAVALVRAPGALENEVVVAPREAFLGDADVVPVDDAVGRVSAESIAGYPPGIPALLPGERITPELVAYLRELQDSGARLHGASDPDFRTICVLRTP
jgi:arginine decarboxylase